MRREAFRFIHDGDINLQDLSYCMPKVIAEEAMKLIGATHGKFGKDQLFIWMVRNFHLYGSQFLRVFLHSALVYHVSFESFDIYVS